MNKKSTLGEIMTRNLVVGNPLNTLDQMLQFFSTYKVQHLPIVENDTLIGIISMNDVVDYLSRELLGQNELDMRALNHRFNIRYIMTDNPITLSSQDTIGKAVEILSGASFQSLPIVDDGKLVGLVTNKDLVKFLGKI